MGWVQAVGEIHPVLRTPLPGGDLALKLPAVPLSVLSRTQVIYGPRHDLCISRRRGLRGKYRYAVNIQKLPLKLSRFRGSATRLRRDSWHRWRRAIVGRGAAFSPGHHHKAGIGSCGGVSGITSGAGAGSGSTGGVVAGAAGGSGESILAGAIAAPLA